MKVDTKVNLCDKCKKYNDFPECCDNIKFGDGYGKDNIFACSNYEELEENDG